MIKFIKKLLNNRRERIAFEAKLESALIDKGFFDRVAGN